MGVLKENVKAAEAKFKQSVVQGSFEQQMAGRKWKISLKELDGQQQLLDSLSKALGLALEAAQQRPPLHPHVTLSDVDRRVATRMAQSLRGGCRRDLSLESKSDAWKRIKHEGRVTLGHAFFFPLMELPNGFATAAFAGEAKKSSEDEITVHHPYFLEHVGTLVKDALNFKVPIRQQLLWTKHGTWLTLSTILPPLELSQTSQ